MGISIWDGFLFELGRALLGLGFLALCLIIATIIVIVNERK